MNIWNKKYCEIRDNCFYAGKYRSAAHSICNLKYSASKKFLIDCHNGFKLWLSFYYKRASRRT